MGVCGKQAASKHGASAFGLRSTSISKEVLPPPTILVTIFSPHFDHPLAALLTSSLGTI